MEYEMMATLKVKEGVSTKTNKPYRMTMLVVHTEEYGDVEILLNTRTDRAGIVLDMVARNHEKNERKE